MEIMRMASVSMQYNNLSFLTKCMFVQDATRKLTILRIGSCVIGNSPDCPGAYHNPGESGATVPCQCDDSPVMFCTLVVV